MKISAVIGRVNTGFRLAGVDGMRPRLNAPKWFFFSILMSLRRGIFHQWLMAPPHTPSFSYYSARLYGVFTCQSRPLPCPPIEARLPIDSTHTQKRHALRQLRPILKANLSIYYYYYHVLIMLLVANSTKTKWCKKPEKWLKPWHMGTHLRVLRVNVINTNEKLRLPDF